MTTKSILITGASSGIGKYASGVLAHRGWIVWAGYIEENGEEELLKIHSKNIRPLKLDVTDTNSINDAKKVIIESGVKLNVLLNDAGIALGGPMEMIDIEKIKKVYDVNFFGYIRMIQAFLPLLRESSGRIVNMSSIGGFLRVPFVIPYASSKSAVECMSDQLRRELLNQNVSVVLIEPSSIRTPIWKKSLKNSNMILDGNPEILSHYEPAISHLNLMAKHSNENALPLSRMKKIIIHATESKKPKARYLISKVDLLLKAFIAIMPAKFIDFCFRKYLKY